MVAVAVTVMAGILLSYGLNPPVLLSHGLNPPVKQDNLTVELELENASIQLERDWMADPVWNQCSGPGVFLMEPVKQDNDVLCQH